MAFDLCYGFVRFVEFGSLGTKIFGILSFYYLLCRLLFSLQNYEIWFRFALLVFVGAVVEAIYDFMFGFLIAV